MKTKPLYQNLVYDRVRPRALSRYYARLTDNERAFSWFNRRAAALSDDLTGMPPPCEAGRRVVEDLRRDGLAFGRVEEFLPAELYDRLRAHFYARLAEVQAQGDRKIIKAKRYLVLLGDDLVLGRPGPIEDVVTHPQLALTAGTYMQLVPRYHAYDLWHTFPTEQADRVASQCWHRDLDDLTVTKIFIYFNDVDENSGPFEYIRGTQRGGRHADVLSRKFRGWGPAGYASEEEYAAVAPRVGSDVKVCTGAAGTLIFADTAGFHRGGKCVSGCRDVMIISFFTRAAISRSRMMIAPDFAGFSIPYMQRVFGLES